MELGGIGIGIDKMELTPCLAGICNKKKLWNWLILFSDHCLWKVQFSCDVDFLSYLTFLNLISTIDNLLTH